MWVARGGGGGGGGGSGTEYDVFLFVFSSSSASSTEKSLFSVKGKFLGYAKYCCLSREVLSVTSNLCSLPP